MLQTPAGQEDIGGDHDIMGLDVLDDPVIGLVKPTSNNLQPDPPLLRDPHPRVGYQGHIKLITARDAIDFLFDRAGISIDVDVQQD